MQNTTMQKKKRAVHARLVRSLLVGSNTSLHNVCMCVTQYTFMNVYFLLDSVVLLVFGWDPGSVWLV